MSTQRLRAAWSGAPVTGAGVSTFYSAPTAGSGLATAVNSFFNSVKGLIPTGVQINVDTGGDLFDELTGSLLGSWGTSGTTVVTCSGAAAHSQGVGGRVVWATSGIRNGRRVRGSTFIVPISAGNWDNDGTLLAAAVTTLNTAAAALVTALGGDMRIWSRPEPGNPGVGNIVTSGACKDATSWLRSRRT